MQTISYEAWQKLRTRARELETKERETELDRARPPFQVSIGDQVTRHALARLEALESRLEVIEGRSAAVNKPK